MFDEVGEVLGLLVEFGGVVVGLVVEFGGVVVESGRVVDMI